MGQDWELAARLLADVWPGLQPGGQGATVHALLAGFPAEERASAAELAALATADGLAQGVAGGGTAVADAGGAGIRVGAGRPARTAAGPARVFGLLLARQRGDVPGWSRKRGVCRPLPKRRRR